MPGRLVVISNRVSVPSGRASAGGLAVGVGAALRERGGLWLGWSGEIAAEPAAEPRLVDKDKITYGLLDLSETERDEYYGGFANRTLWPLFHYRVDLTAFEAGWFATYQAVNKRFAQATAPLLRDDDLIWVHDFHLIPLGEELRRMGAKQPLGFFLHIPFPPAQLFAALPCHEVLANALCAYDVIGFHTAVDVEQFSDYVVRELRGAHEGEGRFRVGERRFRVIACPIGVDIKELERARASAEARRQAKALTDSIGGRQLVVGVDRLDYSKGIPERLRAYEMLIRNYAEHRREVVMLQISAPSREDLPEYRELRRATERLAGHINGRFADHDWAPLRHIIRTHSRRSIAGFFSASRVGLVTPLRDGLNLVAEEYVVAQLDDDPGVLVLSRFAGAAAFLDGALVVNPYDVPGTAEALHRALTMKLPERQERHATLIDRVRANDIVAWRRRFLEALEGVGTAGD